MIRKDLSAIRGVLATSRRLRSAAKDLGLDQNKSLGAFDLLSSHPYPDFSLQLYVFQHRVLKTKAYHLATEDPNSAFGFLFRTLPDDHKGKPHILEHTVLCGSQKFPVKDPFMKMLKRSLNTFMNAMTGSDLTLYPFSTHNRKDFANLLSVYADAVFKPHIKLLDFLQEGVRRDLEEDALTLKGVVFNEMEGDLESQDNFVMEETKRRVFRGSEYEFCAGGLPLHIPELTHRELFDFYTRNYHPSNAVLLSYGNMHPKDTFDFLESEYLRHHSFDSFRPMPRPPQPLGLDDLKIQTISSPAPAKETRPGNSSQLVMSFQLPLDLTPLEKYGLQILSSLLFDFPASPFYQKFISNEKCGGYCAGNGYEGGIRYPYFTIGLRDISDKTGDCAQLVGEMMQVLREVEKSGFAQDLIDGELHLIELSARANKSNFGVKIFETLCGAFNYEDLSDIELRFNLTTTMKTMREAIGKGFLQRLLRKCLIDNGNRVVMHFQADPNFGRARDECLQRLLATEQSALTAESRAEIAKNQLDLKMYQEQEHPIGCLPKLQLSDIPLTIDKYQLEKRMIAGVPVSFVPARTNGLTFIRLRIDITGFPTSLSRYLFLYTKLFSQLGVQGVPFEEWNLIVANSTSGINVRTETFTLQDSREEPRQFLVFEVSGLDRNLEEIFNIYSRSLREIDFRDHRRMSSMLKVLGSAFAGSFVNKALSLASAVAERGVALPQRLYSSYENVRFGAEIAADLQTTNASAHILDDLMFNLEAVHQIVMKKERMHCAVHSSPENEKQVEKRLKILFSDLNGLKLFNMKNEPIKTRCEVVPEYLKDFYVIPSNVNYIAESFEGVPLQHEDFPKILVLSKLLTYGPLLRVVRERDGAYGAECKTGAGGAITLLAFRSPKQLGVFTSFEEAVTEVAGGQVNEEDLEGAKMSFF